MNFGEVTSTLDSVVKKSLLTENVQSSFSDQLTRIKRRISDDKIYIGIVGEFSSGKSTFINSLIGNDFFRTNSLQGTTTTITKLEYGNRVDLKIVFSNGRTLRYSKDKTKILKLYCPTEYEELDTLQKIGIRFCDLFHLCKADKSLLDVFDKITTSNEISKTLKDVTVYYPSEILKDGLVVVDTPGTDSLIPAHAETTRRAIQEICDIALVITTASQVLPQTLVNYLDHNLGDVTDKCIYVITKIELIRKAVERSQIPKTAIQRIKSFLGVDNPQVFMAPSLLSLEERDIIQKTGFTDHLTLDERKTLCLNYTSDIKRIVDKIQREKESTIKHKIQRLITLLREDLQSEIEAKEKLLKNELEETHMMRVKPLRDFMNEFYASHTVFQYSYIETLIINAVSSYKSRFKNYIFDKIDRCSSKDETQSTMESPSTVLTGNDIYGRCYDDFIKVLNDTKSSFVDNFEDFRTSFFEMFSIEAIDFEYTIINNPNWQKQYDFSYDKTNLTTFPLFRMFKSLDSIKRQMKDDVGPKIDNAFARMEKHYLSCARRSHANIEKQMEKVKRIFIKKYEKVIDKRIKESDKKEKMIKSQLVILKNNLSMVRQLKS